MGGTGGVGRGVSEREGQQAVSNYFGLTKE